ncbi:hypothetical protein ACWC2T_12925, partial [Streptomyces sp. NPDC001393]
TYDVLAVELSSYQLHWAPSLRAHSARPPKDHPPLVRRMPMRLVVPVPPSAPAPAPYADPSWTRTRPKPGSQEQAR